MDDKNKKPAGNAWTKSLLIWVGVLFGLVLFAAERLSRPERTLEEAKPLDAVIIGLAQACSLVPGVSRSGFTISAALFRGFAGLPDQDRLVYLTTGRDCCVSYRTCSIGERPRGASMTSPPWLTCEWRSTRAPGPKRQLPPR